jgi:hypothetical protein
MSLLRHAVVKNNVVINVIEYPSDITGTCPEGLQDVVAIKTDKGQINWVYQDNDFFDPVELAMTPEEKAARDAANAEALIPKEVTQKQARLALLNAGLLDTIDAMVAAMPGEEGVKARIIWQYASSIQRSDPLVSAIIGTLSLTKEQLDALFIAASVL